MKIDFNKLAAETAEKLKNSDAPKIEVNELIYHVFGLTKTDIIIRPERDVEEDLLEEFYRLVEKRSVGYPLQYIIGQWDFFGNTFFVSEGVLIPRCETEQISDTACRFLKYKADTVVFDICAGSGCIGLSIASNVPDCNVYMFDVSKEAIECQKKNLENMKLDNVFILDYDIFKGFDPSLLPDPDVILSNPPYIDETDMKTLQTEVMFEPELALYGGADGLDFYRCLVKDWLPFLNDGGFYMFECGEDQPQKVLEMIKDSDLLLENEIHRDIFGIERFNVGYKRR